MQGAILDMIHINKINYRNVRGNRQETVLVHDMIAAVGWLESELISTLTWLLVVALAGQ